MNYIEEIADQIKRTVSPRKLPSEDTLSLFRLYAVLAIVEGTAVTLEDLHDA